MSAIYNLEPQPTASAIIHTTQGDLLVELFAKQTPLTCRNFLQLSLDGYYDNTIFHRLVPGFILQGGDPTGTGEGGESIYDRGAFSGDFDPWPMDVRKGRNAGPTGVNFKDEFHSRLKFNRRGLLGMANEGRPDTNGSQFFFTLDKADELTGKNTVFGRVAGDSIYNLKKMGEAELEEGGERPLYPAKVTSIEILVNPFEDMKKRERVAPRTVSQKPAAAEKKQKKRKGGKQLLSFGDEEGDADDAPVLKKAKFDTRIVMDVDEEPAPKKKAAKLQASKPSNRDEKPSPRTVPVTEAPPPNEQAKRSLSPPSRPAPKKETTKPVRDYESDSEDEAPKKSLLEKTNEEIAALKASMKRTIHSEPVKEKHKTVLETLIPETSIRGRKRKPGAKDDLMAIEMLKAFEAKVKQAPPKEDNAEPAPAAPSGPEGKAPAADDEEAEVCDLHFIANCQSCQSWDKREAEEESGDEGWMSHTLSFTADKLGKDLSYRKKAEEELVVIDPLEKARTLKEEKKAARDARAGATGRAWDQGRKAGRAAK
ncbi:peptidyl-prolyl isomerase CWC27 [Coniochaeta ligniaria NRRL 30616]|uniref:peptidylprolyl isomerase n=1 Tax=Coniochaeta ligniaria NRRL 30616 TaxID=1408157 RepID=A0A1J7IKD5_9PEZI|nr:peptidyl-prolyl isomerase CWC27 [Coniochaeta ligniaria NRRL 30616]